MTNKLKAQGVNIKIKNLKYDDVVLNDPTLNYPYNITTMFFAYDIVESKIRNTIINFFKSKFNVVPVSWEVEFISDSDECVYNLVNDEFNKELIEQMN